MDNTNNKRYKQKVEKITILLLCLFMSVTTFWVLMFRYIPDKNTVAAIATVSMDTIAMFVLILFVLNITYEKITINRTAKMFLGLLFASAIGLFFDFLTWTSDGELMIGNKTFFFTIASLCTASIVVAFFVNYLGHYMEDVYGIKSAKRYGKWCFLWNIGAFVITVCIALTNNAFVFVNGHYETGPLYDIVTALPVLSVVFMASLFIRHHKKIGMHDVVAVLGYILIMIIGVYVESKYLIGTTYISIAIADVLIFVLLQNKLIDRTQRDAEQWMHKSNTDELTGLLNRNAYEEDIVMLETEQISDDFVYVSMDVNGLKNVNDSQGHKAGDELINGAGECVRKVLGSYGKIYRTGGDEFVALIFANDEQVEKIKTELIRVNEKWHSDYNNVLTLSCGYVQYKENKKLSVHQIAVLADKRMYDDKRDYYQKKGIDRRGQRDVHAALKSLCELVLKVNLSRDSYQVVIDATMQSNDVSSEKTFSAWVSERKESICDTDVAGYTEHTNIEALKDRFKASEAPIAITYMKKSEGAQIQERLLLSPAEDYTNEEQIVFLYITYLPV